MDLSEIELRVFFDLLKWESLKNGNINSNDVSKEFQAEKDRINDHMHNYIFNKYKHNTHPSTLIKSSGGYIFSRICHKYYIDGCKTRWNFRINIKEKSACLNCSRMCNHVVSEITSTKRKKGVFKNKSF